MPDFKETKRFKMPYNKLKELLDFARHTDLQEIVWEKNGVRVSFRRAEGKASPAPAGISMSWMRVT